MLETQLDDLLREATQQRFSYWQLLERFLSAPARFHRERSIEHRIRRVCSTR
jgi:hypothetical protein